MEEKAVIDLKDKRILYELDLDSRQSFSQIGKKVKLPKTVVHYRIEKLKEKGIIKNLYAFVNFTKLGFTQYKIYLKFHSLSLGKEKEVTNYLQNKKQIAWIASCHGNWDLAVTVIAKDIVDFDKILKDIINRFGKFILDKDILIVSFSPMWSRNYLVPEKIKQEFVYMNKIENKEIDKEEKEILSILAKNAETSILDIMDKLKISRDVASYRIKKLEKEGIILAYRALINLEKINYHLYKVILSLTNFSEQEEKQLILFCKSKPEITQYLRLVGNSDVEIEVETESEEKVYNIINELRTSFDKLIKNFEVLHITEEHALNSFPI